MPFELTFRRAVVCLSAAAIVTIVPLGASYAADDVVSVDAPIMSLTPEQTATAIDLAKSENALNSILGGRPHTTEVGAWTTMGGKELIGAAIKLRFEHPVSGTFTWPGLADSYGEGLSKKYDVSTHRVKVKRANGLSLLIDFDSGKVVSIETTIDADVESLDPPTDRAPSGE